MYLKCCNFTNYEHSPEIQQGDRVADDATEEREVLLLLH